MIQIEAREAIVIVLALWAGAWFLVKTLARQFKAANDTQLVGLNEAIKTIDTRSDTHVRELRESIGRLDRDLRAMEVGMPREFVRKEDYVQATATVEAKIDAVQARQEHLLTLLLRQERTERT